jgi:hypothetical protein
MLILIKKYYDYDFDTFANDPTLFNDNILSNLLLHTLLTIKYVIIGKFHGRYSDVSMKNILIHKTNKKYINYVDSNGNSISVRTLGWIVKFSDFGSSFIQTNTKSIIMRTNWSNKRNPAGRLGEVKWGEFDYAYDMFILFKNLHYAAFGNDKLSQVETTGNKVIAANWILELYTSMLLEQNFTLFSTDRNNYYTNCIKIDDFINLDQMQLFLLANTV